MSGFKGSTSIVPNIVTSDLQVDGTTLVVDETNNRLGIGIATPKTELTVEGTITVKERAAAQGDTAAYGQLWVKSDAPCNLYFTDDSGQDVQITSDGSLAGVAGSLSGLGSNDNRIVRTNGTGGETAQGSGITIDDSNNVSGMGTLACGAITSTADTATFTSTNADDPLVVIKNTASDATGARLRFIKDKGAAGAANDVAGLIEFYADDASQDQVLFSEIKSQVAVHTNGQEGGKLTLSVASHDGESQPGLIITDGSVEDEVDVTIGNGAASLTTIAGTSQFNGNATFGVDDTGVDVRIFSATGDEGVLYDASEDELALLLTTKLKFHDVGGGEEIFASSNGHLEINAGTTLDMTAPTVDVNASTAVTIDGPSVVIANSATNTPVVEIKNTHNGGTSAELKFNNTEAAGAGAIGDDLGRITFYGQDAGSNNQQFGEILCETAVVTAGQEGGALSLKVAEHDGTMTTGLYLSDGDADGEIDVTIGAGGSSLVSAPGDLKVAGTLEISSSNGEALRISKAETEAREIVFENEGTDKAAIYLNAAENFFIRQEAASADLNLRVGSVNVISLDGGNSQAVFSWPILAGTAAGSGVDTFLYTAGTAAHVGIQWDADGNTEGTLIGGADDHGVDFKFFGETSGRFVQWDMSGDELVLAAASKLSFHDAAGGENIVASSDGHLEVNAGTTLDMTAPTVDVNASTAVTVDTPGVTITDSTTSSATEGGFIRLVSDDGAAMANDHRLGVVEFAGAEDASSTITVGAKIEAICDAAWSATENGTALVMSTTDANASQSEVLRLDSDKLATFAGAALFNGNATFGVDDTGVDVRFFSATASEGVLYDASEDELALLLTTKLKFHDVGGDEEIYASSDGHLEVNAGTTLDMTAPTIDINASTAVTVDSDLVTFGSANANDPLVIIKNTANDTASSRLRFVKDRGAAGEDNDNIGAIEFYGDDDAQDNIEFASIGAQVADASNGAEGGRLVFRVATHDGEMQSGLTIQDGDAEDEVDVTIGNGAASLTTIAGEMKVTEDFFQGDARRVIYQEVDVRKCDSTDNTVSVQFGNKIPQDSVVTRVVAIVKTASNLGTHNVNIRFDVGDGRAADYNAASTSSEALGGGASTTRSSTNVGSAVDIDLTAAKESYINDTPSFMTTADVYPYVMNAGTSNGTSDASSGTLLIYIEYYGID